MGTAAGVRAKDGVVVVTDGRISEDEQVRTDDFEHLISTETYALATVGSPGPVQSFQRSLEREIQQYELDRETDITVEPLTRIASEYASETGTATLIAALTEAGEATLRGISTDGGVSSDPTSAIGDGMETIIGLVDAIDTDQSVERVAVLVRDRLDTASERDVSIGPETTVAIIEDQA